MCYGAQSVEDLNSGIANGYVSGQIYYDVVMVRPHLGSLPLHLSSRPTCNRTGSPLCLHAKRALNAQLIQMLHSNKERLPFL